MAVLREQHSVMTSLVELRAIEEQRIADEREVIRTAELARVAAIEAEAQQRREAEDARLRFEHEARLAIEQARVDAEREARLRLEAAEAAERARHQAALEEIRLAQELELRREEIAKQRPRWMVAVTAIAVAAAVALVVFAIDRMHVSDAAIAGQRASNADLEVTKRGAAEARARLVALEQELAALDEQAAGALVDLGRRQTQAELLATKARIEQQQRDRAAVRARIQKAREDAAKIERGQIVDLSECAGQVLCEEAATKRRRARR